MNLVYEGLTISQTRCFPLDNHNIKSTIRKYKIVSNKTPSNQYFG